MSYHSGGYNPYQISGLPPWPDLTSDLPINPLLPGARKPLERFVLIYYTPALNYLTIDLYCEFLAWLGEHSENKSMYMLLYISIWGFRLYLI